jgi:hypothetical protein
MIGDVVIAEPKNRSRAPDQYVVVREWKNALELVPGRPGITSYAPIRVELDGNRAWVILGRGRCDSLIHQLLKWLKEDSKGAVVEWTIEAKSAFETTAQLLESCLNTKGLIGAKIIAEQPYGPGAGEFIVLNQGEAGLWVVPTDVCAYGHGRLLMTHGRNAWHVISTSPGITDLKALIVTLSTIAGTEAQREQLQRHFDRMMS